MIYYYNRCGFSGIFIFVVWYKELCLFCLISFCLLQNGNHKKKKQVKLSEVDDIRTFLITNYKTMISPRIILQLILLKYLRQYHDRDETINQSILKILLIIDYKSVISIMLIIPKGILFKHATVNNVHYGSDRKPF